jgi:hypothetical protein
MTEVCPSVKALNKDSGPIGFLETLELTKLEAIGKFHADGVWLIIDNFEEGTIRDIV